MKELTKNTALVGLSEGALLIVALVRNKYLAVTIGPEGFGLFELLNTFFNYAVLIAGTWMSMAVLKYVSEYHSNNDDESVSKILSFSMSTVFFLSLAISLILLIAYKPICKLFLFDQVIFSYYALFCGVFIAQVISNFLVIFLQGIKQVATFVKIRIFSQIVTLITLIVLVYLFDLLGFFISILVGFLFLALLLIIAIRKKVKFKIGLLNFKDEIVKKVLKFSLLDSILGFIDQTVAYLQRFLIIGNLSILTLGIFSAANSLQSKLSIIPTSSLFYFKAHMSEQMDNNSRAKALNDYIYLTSFICILLFSLTLLFNVELIKLLFSSRFLELKQVLIFFLVSSFISNVQVGFMFTIVGMAKLKIHGLGIILSAFFVLGVPFFFIKQYGLITLPIGMGLGSLLRILIGSTYLGFYHKVRISKGNIVLILIGLASLIVAFLVSRYLLSVRIVISIFAIAVWYFSISKNYRTLITQKIIEKLKVSK